MRLGTKKNFWILFKFVGLILILFTVSFSSIDMSTSMDFSDSDFELA